MRGLAATGASPAAALAHRCPGGYVLAEHKGPREDSLWTIGFQGPQGQRCLCLVPARAPPDDVRDVLRAYCKTGPWLALTTLYALDESPGTLLVGGTIMLLVARVITTRVPWAPQWIRAGITYTGFAVFSTALLGFFIPFPVLLLVALGMSATLVFLPP